MLWGLLEQFHYINGWSMLSRSFLTISQSNEFEKCKEKFSLATEGIYQCIAQEVLFIMRGVSLRQLVDWLDDLEFEFYNYSDKLREKQRLASLYNVAELIGRDFVSDIGHGKTIKVKGFAEAIFYQQLLKELLQVREELVIVNMQALHPNLQKMLPEIVPTMLSALSPNITKSPDVLNEFVLSIENIVQYLQRKAK